MFGHGSPMKMIGTTQRSLVALATLASTLGFLAHASDAGAAPGTYYRGGLYCQRFGYESSFFGTAPSVRAANLTSGVDKQTVYWNVQMYEQTASRVVKLDDLNPNAWVHATATDTGYTNTWYNAAGTYLGANPGRARRRLGG